MSPNGVRSHALTEAVVIVASILLAFLVQAGWEYRQERAAEAEYLAAIRDEIERNLEALAGNVRVASNRDSALHRAEALLRSGLHADSASVFVASLATGARSGGPPRIATAVFDELTSTGRIIVIRDLSLRRAILELYARSDMHFQRMARNAEQVDTRLFAEVSRHLPSGTLSRGSNPLELSLDLSSLAPPELRDLAVELASDPVVLEELRAQSVLQVDETFYRDQYREALLEARSLLDAVTP
jgi:hypothetical protein